MKTIKLGKFEIYLSGLWLFDLLNFTYLEFAKFCSLLHMKPLHNNDDMHNSLHYF